MQKPTETPLKASIVCVILLPPCLGSMSLRPQAFGWFQYANKEGGGLGPLIKCSDVKQTEG